MRDLTARRRNRPSKRPAGVAFEIADLIFAGFWAALHDFDIRVRLDHGTDDEEFEEVIEFRTATTSRCRFIMWRSPDAICLQPILGRRTEFASVAEALQGILSAGRPPAR